MSPLKCQTTAVAMGVEVFGSHMSDARVIYQADTRQLDMAQSGQALSGSEGHRSYRTYSSDARLSIF